MWTLIIVLTAVTVVLVIFAMIVASHEAQLERDLRRFHQRQRVRDAEKRSDN